MAERQSHTNRGIKGTAWLLGACLSLLPIFTHALGLGRIKVHSTLNEPLNAEIEFTSVTDKELKGLNATLASRAEFEVAGIERMPYLSSVKFIVAKRLDGRHILQLTTEQPIEEPFLHMLVQVEWTGGRLVREYSALIDPPAHLIARPKGIEPPSVPEVAAAPEPAPVVIEPVAPAPAPSVEPLVKEEPAAVAKIDALPAVEEAPKAEPLVEPLAPVPADAARQDDFLGPKASAPVVEEIPSGPITPHAVQEPEPGVAKEAAAEAPVMAAPSAAPGDWASVSEYTVRNGDTLWHVAERLRNDQQLAMEQVILAIYRNNPDAFFGKNVNNLRAGAILKMPERESVTDVSADLARREFRAQYNVWQEYKLKLAAGSQALTVPEPTEAPKVEPPPVKEAKAPAAKAEKPLASQAAKQPDELLKIVRANLQGEKGTPDKKVAETESTKDAKERQALAERVTTLEESLVSRQLEAKELSDRIGAVRAQLKRENRLIEIESQQLAQAQQKDQAPAAAKPEPKPAAKPAEPPKAEPPKVAEATKVEEQAKAPAPAPVVKTPVPAAKPRPAVVPPPAPAEEPGFFSGILGALLDNELLPALIGVVVLASGALGFVYYRRRRKAIGEFEESILSSEAISSESAAATTTDTAGQVATAGDTSFLSDFSQGGMGNVHTDEVDPIAEAEVYLAYGRDETAEEILKDAVVKNPGRQELKVKLLEIYHQRSDVKAFETLAEELYAALGGRRDKVWEKVEEMGRKLNPANPMFRGGAPGKKAEAPASAFGAAQPAFVAAAQESPKTVATGTIDFNLGEASAGSEAPTQAKGVDFDLDLGATQAVESASMADEGKPEEGDAFGLGGLEPEVESLGTSRSAQGQGIDFDLGAAAEPEAPPTSRSVDFSPAPKSEGAIDFDMDLGGTPSESPASASTEAAGGETPSAQWDETATKLDLAKAYIDMGDAEGARSILDEVLAEGSDDQKRQAKELAAQLS